MRCTPLRLSVVVVTLLMTQAATTYGAGTTLYFWGYSEKRSSVSSVRESFNTGSMGSHTRFGELTSPRLTGRARRPTCRRLKGVLPQWVHRVDRVPPSCHRCSSQPRRGVSRM